MNGRRESLGRSAKEPVKQAPQPVVTGKRRLSVDGGAAKKQKMPAGAAAGEVGKDPKPRDRMADMMVMMQGLTAKMDVVHADIGLVRKDLGEQIAKGTKETAELKKRMDENDATFADRVAAVVAAIPGGPCAGGGDPCVLGGRPGRHGECLQRAQGRECFGKSSVLRGQGSATGGPYGCGKTPR